MSNPKIDEVKPLDRDAVASEIFIGCVNTLHVLGFSDEEIAGLLRNTADDVWSIDRNRPSFSPFSGLGDVPAIDHEHESDDLWILQDEFEASEAAKTLQRLDKRISSFYLHRGSNEIDLNTLKRAHEILLQALNARREVVSWLQSAADRKKIRVEPYRDAWRVSASDVELDAEDSILFLDDYMWSGDFHWGIVGRLSKILCDIGEQKLVAEISDLVTDGSLVLPEGDREEVLQALQTVSVYDQFRKCVRSAALGGEVIQSTFIDAVEREFGSTGTQIPAHQWLSNMASNGEIERYKKSNRWRFSATQVENFAASHLGASDA
ncbi:MAG: hypothetical protein JJ873_12800 [Maricaulis sp.]|uniref:hypothetical protein n=1 Tax=Maricaulis sp. TaxID=1486257 RepID=UPI001B2278F4|nr:hypothetical protein [Maricaulis sp.]MBO6878279.1 hypothetical protein [Maricaulis sp.]